MDRRLRLALQRRVDGEGDAGAAGEDELAATGRTFGAPETAAAEGEGTAAAWEDPPAAGLGLEDEPFLRVKGVRIG